MMYAETSSATFLWLCIHFFFMGIALFGFIAALFWLYKHASKKDFLKIVWLTLGIGLVGSLLTGHLAMRGLHNSYVNGWDSDEMMGGAILDSSSSE